MARLHCPECHAVAEPGSVEAQTCRCRKCSVDLVKGRVPRQAPKGTAIVCPLCERGKMETDRVPLVADRFARLCAALLVGISCVGLLIAALILWAGFDVAVAAAQRESVRGGYILMITMGVAAMIGWTFIPTLLLGTVAGHARPVWCCGRCGHWLPRAV